MEREAPQGYDVLAIDAFSGGSIPVHLLTGEAIDVYLRHLKPDGVLAFHVTNRYLDLPPVLLSLARDKGLAPMLIHDEAENSRLRATDWLLLSRSPARLQAFATFSQPITPRPGVRSWSDDHNNLFVILR